MGLSRNIAFLLLFLFSSICVFAQTPFGLNYQAVARDLNTGNSLADEDILIEFQVRVGAANGSSIYTEQHNTATDDLGLFNLIIGQGTAISGDFTSINWGSNVYFLATLIDDGDGLQEIGSMQFLSVPYALHANTVSNPEDADADPNNETNLSLNFDEGTSQLEIIDLAGALNVDLSSLVDDDGDPSNELISTTELNGTELTITENGTPHTVDLELMLPVEHWTENGGAIYQTITDKVGVGPNNTSPNSTFDVNGSVSYNATFINVNNFAVQDDHHYLLVNNNSAVNITLPSSFDNEGREYVFVFKNVTNSSIGFATVDDSTINGNLTFSITPTDTKQVYSVISFGAEGWYFVHGL
ncbi:MAG: hypothetical protein HKN39_01115 [Flavobacteriales bacterium]|nr:hypothetical protein [Flavobacteriales bacterium]